jgi:hypothetical protein
VHAGLGGRVPTSDSEIPGGGPARAASRRSTRSDRLRLPGPPRPGIGRLTGGSAAAGGRRRGRLASPAGPGPGPGPGRHGPAAAGIMMVPSTTTVTGTAAAATAALKLRLARAGNRDRDSGLCRL